MRISLLSAAVAAAAAVAVSITPASAINTYNSSPAPERTEVGAFMALWHNDTDGTYDRFDWVCSGAMVDDDTYLTAGHCTSDWPPQTHFYVSLEQDVDSKLADAAADDLTPAQTAARFLAEGWAVEADSMTHPSYPGPSSNTFDIGVLEFGDRAVTPADVWSFTPAELPEAGQLARQRKALDDQRWLVVGYGTQEATRGPGGHQHLGGGTRLKAPESFNALNKAWVRLSMIRAHGNGGACYGDSGGPNYVTLGGERLLAATTITGDVPCYATNVVYRTDTASARNFLDEYVDLP